MTCPRCGAEMNRHAEKLIHPTSDDPHVDPVLGGIVEELHRCPACGSGATSTPSAT